jgi:hypothetical protein
MERVEKIGDLWNDLLLQNNMEHNRKILQSFSDDGKEPEKKSMF